MVALVETTSAGSAIVLAIDVQVEPSGDYQWHYTYDDLGQMTFACSDWHNGDCQGDQWQYSYDGAGNLLLFDHWVAKDRTTVTAQYVINGANQVECIDDPSGDGVCDEASKWQYDAYGNLLNDHVNQYTYDAAMRLKTVTTNGATTIYTYNGDGERVSQTYDTNTTYLLDVAASTVLSQTTITGMVGDEILSQETVYFLNGLMPIAQKVVDTEEGIKVSYLQYDGAGSVRQTTDPSGLVLSTQTFDPYGNPYMMPGSDEAWFGFGGAKRDTNGLIYSRGQYYNPWQGRSPQFGLCNLLPSWCQRQVQSQVITQSSYASASDIFIARAYLGLSDAAGPLTAAAAITSAPVLPGVAALAGAHSLAIGTTFAFGYTYGAELLNNRSTIEQEGFWAAQTHLNWGRIGGATAIAGISGGLNQAAGLAGATRIGAALWVANAAWDTSTDVAFYDDSLGGALAVNLAFGFFDLPGNAESRLVRGVAGGGPLEGLERLAYAGATDETIDDVVRAVRNRQNATGIHLHNNAAIGGISINDMMYSSPRGHFGATDPYTQYMRRVSGNPYDDVAIYLRHPDNPRLEIRNAAMENLAIEFDWYRRTPNQGIELLDPKMLGPTVGNRPFLPSTYLTPARRQVDAANFLAENTGRPVSIRWMVADRRSAAALQLEFWTRGVPIKVSYRP